MTYCGAHMYYDPKRTYQLATTMGSAPVFPPPPSSDDSGAAMKTYYTVALAMLAGIGVGASPFRLYILWPSLSGSS